ncbi:hypothetical protein [Desulfocastanea catecholica]
MNKSPGYLCLLAAALLFFPATCFANDDMRPRDGKRWWRGELREDFWNGPCEVKIEAKRGEFKREIKSNRPMDNFLFSLFSRTRVLHISIAAWIYLIPRH